MLEQLKCEQKFGMGSVYDYNKQIEVTLVESIPGWVRAKCPIKKIIRTISNITKLNLLQGCLLSWLLSKSKFEIERISIRSRTKFVEEEFDHKVLVFTLLNAYYIKKFVCENVSMQIDNEILSHIPDFKAQYDLFNPEKSLKTLSLSDINKLFSQWTCRQVQKNKTDYNNLVDKILYLSKTYNVNNQQEQKSQKLGLPRKRRKNNHDQMKSDVNSAIQKEKSVSMHEKKPFNKLSNSLENGEFISLSQQNPFRRDEPEMGLMRRSTRNMLQSINIYDIIPSQDNLFYSQASNNGMFNSSLQNSLFESKTKKEQKNNDISGLINSGMRLRHTSSFDLK